KEGVRGGLGEVAEEAEGAAVDVGGNAGAAGEVVVPGPDLRRGEELLDGGAHQGRTTGRHR
ncbi:MAG TPA: hypothetical protein VLY85_04200, partial [Thermoplasmata archaeon]|nr:hypothetical protein [Thermoplasmata archaeon]